MLAEIDAEDPLDHDCPACFNGGPPHYRKCGPGWGFGEFCKHYEPEPAVQPVQLDLFGEVA